VHVQEGPKEDGAAARESYIEGEIEALSAVLRDIPAGSAVGAIFEEIKATDGSQDFVEGDPALSSHLLAQQHEGRASLPSSSSSGDPQALLPGRSLRRRRHRNLVFRLTGAALRYTVGLVAGAFQALIVVFYQWVVDPAAYGTWPVTFFAYLATGVLRHSMLQFYADSTNFTRRLVSVRANSKFHSPDATANEVGTGKREDLASVIRHLKERHAVRYVYCWHGLSAYWSGVSPDSPLMKTYGAEIIYARPTAGLKEIEPSMLWNPSVLGGLGVLRDPAPLFRDMHSYLAESGVDGVKVDCQAGVGLAGSTQGGGPAAAAVVHAALEDSVAMHFPGNDAINCMCHSTENIYRWRSSAVARASDDFYPTDAASHLPHLAACAYNGLFIAPLALVSSFLESCFFLFFWFACARGRLVFLKRRT
jgi:hypothetical protein